jgi:hypothetical protein
VPKLRQAQQKKISGLAFAGAGQPLCWIGGPFGLNNFVDSMMTEGQGKISQNAEIHAR